MRRLTLISLDNLLALVRQFNNPGVSRSGLDRFLRRHGVGSLRELKAIAREAAGDAGKPVKSSKDYEPGFVHIDIKNLDEAAERYLFAAIDRATRWVFRARVRRPGRGQQRGLPGAPASYADTILAFSLGDFKMIWPDGYLQRAHQQGGAEDSIQDWGRVGGDATDLLQDQQHSLFGFSCDSGCSAIGKEAKPPIGV